MKRPLFTPFCWRQRLYLFFIILCVAISCATKHQVLKESALAEGLEMLIPETTVTEEVLILETTVTEEVLIPETTVTEEVLISETTVTEEVLIPETTVTEKILIPETIVTEEVLIPEEVDEQLVQHEVLLPEVSELKKELILEGVDIPIDNTHTASHVDDNSVEESTQEESGQCGVYEAILSVDEQFYLNKAGELLVSIALKGNSDVPITGKVQDTACFPARLVQYATVRPSAPGFTVDPVCRSCVRIDPSGSDFSFILTPNKKGFFKIGADVILYTSSPCETDGVPKAVHSLSVEVKVDRKENLEVKLNEVFTVVWDSFIKFWKALVALLFGLFLYVIRRRIKAKTGYGQKED